MGIRFTCPSGHKLHVKNFLAGKRGICPKCGAKFIIPNANESASIEQNDASESSQDELTPSADQTPSLESASPSIIISTAEEESPLEKEPSTDPSPAINPELLIAPAAPLDSQSEPVVPIPTATAAAPARYIALRERSRRNQVTLAAALLIAVIILALILLWVLSQNTSQPAALLFFGLVGNIAAPVSNSITQECPS